MMRCPFCHGGIDDLAEGVRCAKCQAPHHLACWTEYGKCSVFGCGSTAHKTLTRLGTAHVVIAAGRRSVSGALAAARLRLGGKSVVALFALSATIAGLGVAPLLYHVHASRKVELEILLGGVFALLAGWIVGLLHQGAELQDDLALRVGARSPGQYYFFMDNTGVSGCSGRNLDGCGNVSSTDADGILGGILVILVVIVVIFVVLPFVAWLAVEVLFPCLVLAVYCTLYSALAFAVNGQQALAGRFLACLRRAVLYALAYTAVVGLVIGVGVRLFHAFAPPH
jgi:hypothetical protein